MGETSLDKGSEGGGGSGVSGTGAEIPLQPVVQTMVSGMSQWSYAVEQISAYSPWRIPHQSRWIP